MLAPQRLAYRLERGNIVLLHWPALDQAPKTAPARYPVLEGVREFKLRYLDNSHNWQLQWPPVGIAGALPNAVEISLILASGESVSKLVALQ